MTASRKERRKADEDLQALLRENNNLLKELFAKENGARCFNFGQITDK